MSQNKKNSEGKKGNLYKLVLYDIRAGFRSNLVKLTAFTVLCVFICIMGVRAISGVAETQNLKPTIMDYICYMVGGPKHIPPAMLDIYVIPVLWLSLQVMIAYVAGYYAVTDLHTYGQQILIRSNSRLKWWLSKCIWNIVTVVFMYGIIYVTSFATAFFAGAEFKNRLTPEIGMSVCNINMVGGNTKEIAIILFLMPVFTSIALSMAQMTSALITSPIIGFIASQSIVFLSTIYEYKFLISNYAMLSHNKITCMSQIEYREGIVINLLVFGFAIVTGLLYFKRCNILPKNQEI